MPKTCSHCGKQVEDPRLLICSHCGTRLTTKNQKGLLKKFWRLTRWGLEHFGIPILILIIGARIINPPSLPDIDSMVVYNTGSPARKPETAFKLDFQFDERPWVRLIAINKGNNHADDFDVEFRLLRNNKITNIDREYIPPSLKRRVLKSDIEGEIFYEKLRNLPIEGGVEYRFDTADFVKSCDDFEYSLLSKSKNWSKTTKIEPKHLSFRTSRGSVAYALEEKSEKTNTENQPAKSESVKSGILVGGYDPLIMSNELFLLLQRKDLISQEQAKQIKTDIKDYKEGVLFGGINILKLNELILNSLISNKVITVDQTREILAKSKNSGGVLIGGYNVIILQVEILNSLLQNKEIEIQEGQKVIDQAKSMTK